MKKLKILLNIALLGVFSLFIFDHTQAQGTWTAVKNLAPLPEGGGMLLLTDGTVMCKTYSVGGWPAPDSGWIMLTPDIHGSYANGTWSIMPHMHQGRFAFSSQVLPNGNVYVAGSEHGNGTASGEIYNTVTKTWTFIPNVPGYDIEDANSELLYDGTVLEGCANPFNPSIDTINMFYSPVTGKFSIAPPSFGTHEETSWLKLPDSSVLFVDALTTNSERYIPQLHKWVHDATVPVNIYDPSSYETGPAILLPNGKALFIGDDAYPAIYTPSGNTSPGSWAVGPIQPYKNSVGQLGSWDGSAAMMVNGKVLCVLSGLASESEPTFFYEYDYLSNSFNEVSAPGGGDSVATYSNFTTMLDLPDGTVLFAYTDSTKFYIYTPSGPPIPQGKPTIDGLFPDSCNRYMITGKLFNGISEGAEFGDDWQMSTNYPVIRLTSGTNVYYAKSFNWNRIGAVRTDSAEDTAYFTLPSLPGGTYSLVVTANGFASSPVTLTTFGVGVTVTNIASCHGTGSATAHAGNGTKPYTYAWSPSGGTDSIASGLSAGVYTVTVTEAGGCSASATATITEPVLNLSVTFNSVHCIGSNTGSATANASAGNPPYTYSWSNGGTKPTITGLSAGTYKITVSDSCGFTAIDSAIITQPDSILSVKIHSGKEVHCNGTDSGSATPKTTGGTRPYTYSWSNGQTNAKGTGLSAGSYTLTVSDSCGATVTVSVTITQPVALVVKLDSVNVTSNVSCNGKAKATVSGGTPPYIYYWTPGGQTLDSIYNQCSGAYCCTITDNSGCSNSVCIVINNTTGVENIESGSGQVSVYPNPNNGVLNIESSVVSGQSTVIVYNMLGEQVYIGKLNATSTQIDLSANSVGIYLYRVITETGSLVGEGKFIIQK